MPHTTRTCPRCTKQYSSTQSACNDCLNAAKRAKRADLISRTQASQCIVCETAFRPKSTRNVTCSDACHKVRAKKLRGTPELTHSPCAYCSTLFMPSRVDSRHCSPRCRERGRYAMRGQTPEYKTYKRRYHRAYHARNQPRLIEKSRKWREANRELHRELSIAWYRANREHSHATSAAWAAANSDRRVLTNQRRRARKVASQVVPMRVEHVTQKMAYWGGKCWMCSGPADTIDHVKPLSAGGAHVLANLRPACRKCNSSKGAKWHGITKLSTFIRHQ